MNPTPVARASKTGRLGAGVAWALLIGLLVMLWPSSLGGCTTLTVISGQSMQPMLQPGDFAVLRCGDPAVGDVIAYRPFPDEAALVIHRITGGDAETGWRLQGDNNNFVDPFSPVESQVRGVLVLSIPAVGTVLGALGLPWVWGTALLLAGVLLWVGMGGKDDEPDLSIDPDPEISDEEIEFDDLLDVVEV